MTSLKSQVFGALGRRTGLYKEALAIRKGFIEQRSAAFGDFMWVAAHGEGERLVGRPAREPPSGSPVGFNLEDGVQGSVQVEFQIPAGLMGRSDGIRPSLTNSGISPKL